MYFCVRNKINMDTVRKRGEIISIEQRSLVSQRYRRITRAVNSEFWGSSSETAHSLYVGSYGRGTAIDTSDIDILVELPRDEYYKYDALRGNGQSRLLQALKNAILQTYPNSDIHGDFNQLVFKLCIQYKLTDTLLIVAGIVVLALKRKNTMSKWLDEIPRE